MVLKKISPPRLVSVSIVVRDVLRERESQALRFRRLSWLAKLFSVGKKTISGISQALNINGGAEEDRTPDLRIANATLSQLSYGPHKGRILH